MPGGAGIDRRHEQRDPPEWRVGDAARRNLERLRVVQHLLRREGRPVIEITCARSQHQSIAVGKRLPGKPHARSEVVQRRDV